MYRFRRCEIVKGCEMAVKRWYSMKELQTGLFKQKMRRFLSVFRKSDEARISLLLLDSVQDSSRGTICIRTHKLGG